MAEGNNIFNRPFGLNVQLPTRTIEEVQKSIVKNTNIFAPLFTYFEENDKVFSGDVIKEIDKYNQQLYSMGSIMREGKHIVTFDSHG